MRLQAAVDYLTPIFKLMGAEEFSFTAVQKGEATILKVRGSHMGVLIGRRGETMESLSYLASLVVNRMEGPYVKLGLDIGGYRDKRESDLSTVAARAAARVIRSGNCYELEPMNPYERHIIHTAIAELDGVRSESKGEGPLRHVVIYSTDPNASNLPERNDRRGPRPGGSRGSYGNRSGGYNSRGPRRDNDRGPRPYGERGPRPGPGENRGPRPYGEHGPRPQPSNVPPREFADTPRDETVKPVAPARTERIHDDDLDLGLFGKIEL